MGIVFVSRLLGTYLTFLITAHDWRKLGSKLLFAGHTKTDFLHTPLKDPRWAENLLTTTVRQCSCLCERIAGRARQTYLTVLINVHNGPRKHSQLVFVSALEGAPTDVQVIVKVVPAERGFVELGGGELVDAETCVAFPLGACSGHDLGMTSR